MPTDMVSTTDDLAFINFKMGCKNILDELNSLYASKKRQIEMCFDRLIDNVPNEIVDAPIMECLEEYFENLKSKEFQVLAKSDKQTNVVNQSICDTMINDKAPSNLTSIEDELIGDTIQEFKNLTSTVKKINNGKLKSLKDKIDEQSMIQEVDDETPTKEPKKTIKVNKENIKPLKIDKYSVKVLYFLKDLTQVSVSLNELTSVDENLVHQSSLEDLKIIAEAYASKNKYKK